MKSRAVRFDEACEKFGMMGFKRKYCAQIILGRLNDTDKDYIHIEGTGYIADRRQLERYSNAVVSDKKEKSE